MTDHSSPFYEALVKVHDITTNKPLNMKSQRDLRQVVDRALEEARRNDRRSKTVAAHDSFLR